MKHWLILLGLVLAACTSSPQGKESSAVGKLFVFYNNDNIGYLEPCGCRVSPIGGMHRRWNAMMAYPEKQRLFVDAGNLFFKNTNAADYLVPQWYEQAQGVVEAYTLLKADAVTVGETDFALGIKTLQDLVAKANFPFVSANIYWRGQDKLFLPPSVIVEKEGKKIGIFGVFHQSLRLPMELEARDALKAAQREAQNLKEKGADFIVMLSHSGYENDEKMAAKLPLVNVIVGANSQSLLQNPDKVGSTTIVQLSNQGQMLGLLEYKFSEGKATLSSSIVAELDTGYDDAPGGRANPMKNLIAVTNIRMAEANRKLDERLWKAHEGLESGYETFLSCRDCHSSQAQFQEGKPHAAAFLTLMAKKQERNMDCVKCHSVGLGEKTGFKGLADAFRGHEDALVKYEEIRAIAGENFPSPSVEYRKDTAKIRPDVERWIDAMKQAGVKKAFVSVQCENCHGSLPGHPFAQADGAKFVKVSKNQCIQCHTPEQMPAWYAKGKLKEEAVAEAMKTQACPR